MDTDLFAVGDKHDQLLYFLKKRNLLGSYSNKPAEDGRYHLTQMVGNSITVNYDEQKDKIMYIESRWLGDKALRQNAFYSEDEMLKSIGEYVNGRVLTVTARMNDGSIAVKRLGLRSELYQSLDDTNMKIYIYTIQN